MKGSEAGFEHFVSARFCGYSLDRLAWTALTDHLGLGLVLRRKEGLLHGLLHALDVAWVAHVERVVCVSRRYSCHVEGRPLILVALQLLVGPVLSRVHLLRLATALGVLRQIWPWGTYLGETSLQHVRLDGLLLDVAGRVVLSVRWLGRQRVVVAAQDHARIQRSLLLCKPGLTYDVGPAHVRWDHPRWRDRANLFVLHSITK